MAIRQYRLRRATKLPPIVFNRLLGVWIAAGVICAISPLVYGLSAVAVATFLHLGLTEDLPHPQNDD
ncbi:MAG: hypothetical protein AAF541_19095 [Pseudomonadota bacterium]